MNTRHPNAIWINFSPVWKTIFPITNLFNDPPWSLNKFHVYQPQFKFIFLISDFCLTSSLRRTRPRMWSGVPGPRAPEELIFQPFERSGSSGHLNSSQEFQVSWSDLYSNFNIPTNSYITIFNCFHQSTLRLMGPKNINITLHKF